MDSRKLKIIFGKAGGNASKNSFTTKLTIPNSWIKDLDLTPDNREVLVTYDAENKEIIIKKIN